MPRLTHHGAVPSDVALYKAYMASGALTGSQLTESVVARGQGRIVQDTERMLAMDRYGRAGQAEAFSPCAQPAVCATRGIATVFPLLPLV
jgi:hypothetical protein